MFNNNYKEEHNVYTFTNFLLFQIASQLKQKEELINLVETICSKLSIIQSANAGLEANGRMKVESELARMYTIMEEGTRRAAKSYFTLQYRHDKEGGDLWPVVVGQKNYASPTHLLSIPFLSLSLSALPPLAQYYSKKH